MRKLFRTTTLAALALGATALTAQAQGAKQFGVLAGVDFASMTGDDLDGTSTRTGFIGGLYGSFGVSQRFAVEVDALYASKGMTDAFGSGSDVTWAADYIEVPILGKYSFQNDGGIYLLGGGAVGFNMSCQLSDSDEEVDCDDFGLEDNTTFGIVLGAGFQKGRFGIEGRYDFDMGEAYKDVDAKNTAIEVMARIAIK